MTSLTSWIGSQVRVGAVKAKGAELKPGQQVVIRRPAGLQAKSVTEIMAGTLVSLNGDRATVSIPRPGGRIMRAEVGVNTLQPASSMYKRGSVNINPAFRQMYMGKV